VVATGGWAAGTDQTEVQRLSAYWANGFDWYAQQRAMNGLPRTTTTIDEIPLRYLRSDAEKPDALPLILSNGWPSTALELARRRANPWQYGGDAAGAFTVVVPTLPGFLFRHSDNS
jgi:Epoxide hydrolase N terminus